MKHWLVTLYFALSLHSLRENLWTIMHLWLSSFYCLSGWLCKLNISSATLRTWACSVFMPGSTFIRSTQQRCYDYYQKVSARIIKNDKYKTRVDEKLNTHGTIKFWFWTVPAQETWHLKTFNGLSAWYHEVYIDGNQDYVSGIFVNFQDNVLWHNTVIPQCIAFS